MTKILVAEDDSLLSQLLIEHLQLEHYEAHAAFDGAQALEQIKAWKPDLIVLDLLMPTVDGFTVLEEMRKNEEMMHIPVVVLTNVASKEDRARVEKFHVSDYLVKANTSLTDITAKIKAVIV
jgi:two-component system alkaline phosphatase synthesis response regulator PhoP